MQKVPEYRSTSRKVWLPTGQKCLSREWAPSVRWSQSASKASFHESEMIPPFKPLDPQILELRILSLELCAPEVLQWGCQTFFCIGPDSKLF